MKSALQRWDALFCFFNGDTKINLAQDSFLLIPYYFSCYRTNDKFEPQHLRRRAVQVSTQSPPRKALKLGALPSAARQGRCSALRGKKCTVENYFLPLLNSIDNIFEAVDACAPSMPTSFTSLSPSFMIAASVDLAFFTSVAERMIRKAVP